ncbi:MAG: DUF1963 domain-containing protein [Saprospiraceae bacterium]
MIVLKINKPVSYMPVKWAGKDLSEMKPGQSFVRYIGEHPDNPEQGNIELDVTLIEGSFEEIEEILFIDEDPQQAKLISWKKKLFGGYRIEVAFDAIFAHGLKYTTKEFIRRGGGIIGFRENDKAFLKTLEGQKQLLQLLLTLLLANRKSQIEKLAIPALLLKPNDHHREDASHFVGLPKVEPGTEIPATSNHIPLLHLATFDLDEFKDLIDCRDLNQYLTFFINIKDTENGWPEQKDEFKILNTNSISNISGINKPIQPEEAQNFDIQAFLDIPGYDHSVLNTLNLSEEESYQYETLVAIYKRILSPDSEYQAINKFLGYPDSIQNCVAYEAERISSNRDYSDEIYKDATNWKLLLQVSPYCKWFSFFDEFGDSSIYFMIRNEDLMNRNFEAAQLVVQST